MATRFHFHSVRFCRYGAGLHVGRKADHIVVYNRATGLLEEETIDPALAFSMKALYQTCVV
jgi:hypothetical protein